jgi:hypothetical protein
MRVVIITFVSHRGSFIYRIKIVIDSVHLCI